MPAQCVPPWVAVGLWVLSSRLGHVREPPKGDPAKKVGWSKNRTFLLPENPISVMQQWVGRTLGFEVFKTTRNNWMNMTSKMVT